MRTSLDLFRQFCGGPIPSPPATRAPRRSIRATYDAAQTSSENVRHWGLADGLSAASAASPGIRQTLRNRSRYEFDNNAYLRGGIRSIVGHTIGRGPRLTVKTSDAVTPEDASFVERAFREWMEAANLANKLRTLRTAQTVDGEAFALFVTNDRLKHPVTLDLRLVEAEQIATPTLLTNQPDRVDGIVFDSVGNPLEYHLLKYHPGDIFGAGVRTFEPIPAEDVIHLFISERPDQRRGLPEMMASLPLCAYLRRWTLAVVNAAEVAALHSGVIYTDNPADDEDEVEGSDFEAIPLERGMMTTLPRGYKLSQLKAEQPVATYGEFKGELLEEIFRPMGLPKNLATANSSGYNYSSSRLDHQTFFSLAQIERDRIECVVLDRTFAKWLAEAVLIEGYLPDGVRQQSLDLDWEWDWDAPVSIDPVKDATAKKLSLDNHLATMADLDPNWEDRLRQRAREIALMRELGLPMPDAAAYPQVVPDPNAPGTPAPSPGDPGNNPTYDPTPPSDAANARRWDGRMIHAAAEQGRSHVVTMTAAVELTAADPAAEGGPKLATFKMRAYNGGLMNVNGFALPVVVDLAGLSFSRKSRPVLLDHNPAAIVGHTTDLIRADGGLNVAGVISGTGAAAQEVRANAANGFPWQASIGVRLGKTVELKRDKTAVVNGREITGPALIVRTGQFKEVSFVPLGADDNTSASVAARSHGGTMKTFQDFVAACGLDLDSLTDEQAEKMRAIHASLTESVIANPDEQPAPAKTSSRVIKAASEDNEGDAEEPTPSPIEAMRAEAAREVQRLSKLQTIAAAHPDILAKAIEGGWSADRTELEVLRKRPQGPAINGSGARPAAKDVYVAASLMQRGVSDAFLTKQFKEPVLDAAHPMVRNLSLGGLMREILAANQVHVSPMTSNEAMFRQIVALEGRPDVQASIGPLSPISLGGILGDSANKSMLAVLESTPTTFGRIAREVSAKDFKATNVYRLESTGFVKVPPGGELSVATLAERKSTVTAETAGYKIVLDRQEVINDDLGAFLQLPEQIMMNALNYVELQSATALLAGVGSFWASGNSNYISGTDTVLDVNGLTKAVAQFSVIKNSAGQRIGIKPAIILAPPALYAAALSIYQSEFLVTTPATGKSAPVGNIWKGRFQAEYSDFLAASNGVTNASDTAWWLLASPTQSPALLIAYVQGQKTPVISGPTPALNTLGLQWMVYFDFGVALGETISGVMSKGAA